jgi:hypothetical protein
MSSIICILYFVTHPLQQTLGHLLHEFMSIQFVTLSSHRIASHRIASHRIAIAIAIAIASHK